MNITNITITHQMVGLPQSEVGEWWLLNRLLIAVLLVEFAVEADLSVKDAP